MKADVKNRSLMYKLQRAGIEVNYTQAETLRRAELALQRWAEGECGNSNNYSSWCIVRDEETGKPFMEVHPNTGKSYRTAIADRERGAITRVEKVCKELNIHFYHQTDPRGCALYVAREPLAGNRYTDGVACCE